MHTIYLWVYLPVAIDTDVLAGNACETGRYLDPIIMNTCIKQLLCALGEDPVCMYICYLPMGAITDACTSCSGDNSAYCIRVHAHGIVLKYQPVG